MSLPALLSKLSPRRLRFVTIDGRVVTDDVVGNPHDGYSHPNFGHVTRVAPHTNHGGALPDVAPAPPWWEEHPEALAAEVEAMRAAFPGFVRTPSAVPSWTGSLDTGRGRFDVTLIHRPDRGLPRIVPTKPGLFQRNEASRTRKAPHLYINGDLCIAAQTDWDPDTHDATTALAWTAHWLASFTEWRITGRGWPCAGVGTDAN